MLWLCIYLPLLPVEAYPHSTKAPLAVSENHRIKFCNALASSQGIRTGQSLVTAWALYSELEIKDRDHQRESLRLQQLADFCREFTPHVSIPSGDRLLLDLTGCLNVHGGWPKLKEKIQTSHLLTTHHLQFGLGNTPEAAILLSHNLNFESETVIRNNSIDISKIQHLINEQTIANLNCDSKTIQRLANLGLKTVGQVKQLPSHALGHRQSHFFMDYLSRLYGLKGDVRKPHITPPQFHEESYSLQSVSNLSEIQPAFELQLEKLQRFLRQHQQHCIELRWQLRNEQRYLHRLHVGVEACKNNVPSMLKLTQLQSEKQPIKRAINQVALESVHRPLSLEIADDLFPESLSRPLDQQLVETLEARLGRDRISYLKAPTSHRPDDLGAIDHDDLNHAKRPTWLFKSPKLILQRGKQMIFEGQVLSLLQGPERIDTQWWSSRCQRDYYIAKSDRGLRYWVYKDLVNRRWFVQGIFA